MKLRIKEEDLELAGVDGGGSEILHYQGKPFTGILIDYDVNDNARFLCMEVEFENGYREGWVRYYHANGKLEQEYFLHNNLVKPDTYKEYDDEGNLLKGF